MVDVVSTFILERERAKTWALPVQMEVMWAVTVPRPWEGPATAVGKFRICHRQTSSSPLLHPLKMLRPLPACEAVPLAAVWCCSHHQTVLVEKHEACLYGVLKWFKSQAVDIPDRYEKWRIPQILPALPVCNLPPSKPSMVYLFSSQKGKIKSFWGLIRLKMKSFFKFYACNKQRILLCNHLLWNSGWAFGCHMAVLYNYRTCYGLMDEVIKSIVISTSLLLWTAVWCHIFLTVNYICAHTEYSFLTIYASGLHIVTLYPSRTLFIHF